MRSPWSVLWMVLWIGSNIIAAESPIPAEAPPLPPSPVEQFRQWLRMAPEQRTQALADWPEAKRKVIEEKLLAYQAFSEEQRERRLKMLELRWYLRPLMGMSMGQRQVQMAAIPEALQELVRKRLEQWDRLELAQQKQILQNEESRELATTYFAQVRRGQALEPAQLNQLKRSREILNNPKVAAHVAVFFTLPTEQQARTLEHFSEVERREMQRTLDIFAHLTPAERRLCVDSFHKFASMGVEERKEFLLNAARWQAMSPQERETWKELVTKLPPFPPEPEVTPPTPNEVR
jgi:hypothetical protein